MESEGNNTFKVMNQGAKLARIDGMNFTWWKDKILFTALKISYILDPICQKFQSPMRKILINWRLSGWSIEKMNYYVEDTFWIHY